MMRKYQIKKMTKQHPKYVKRLFPSLCYFLYMHTDTHTLEITMVLLVSVLSLCIVLSLAVAC